MRAWVEFLPLLERAHALREKGRRESALEWANAAREGLEKLLLEQPDSRRAFMDATELAGRLEGELGSTEAAIEQLQLAVRLRRDAAENVLHGTPQELRELADALEFLAQAHFAENQLSSAAPLFREAVSLREILVKRVAGAPWALAQLAASQIQLGDVALANGDHAEAIRVFEAAWNTHKGLAGLEPRNPAWQLGLATARTKLAAVQQLEGDVEAERRLLQDARRLLGGLIEAGTTDEAIVRQLRGVEAMLSRLENDNPPLGA